MILRRMLLAVAAVAVAVCASAQDVFMVQGHERPDITARMAQMPARAAADEAVEDTDFSFDDIEFWVGTGPDSAALVIDWYDDKGGTLVWGYLFDADDDAQNTGYAMMAAVAKADRRFVFLTHSTNLGNTVAGIGYDLDESGNIELVYTDPDTKAETYSCPEEGIVTTDEYNYDNWSMTDGNDHWRAGWYNGYWSYQVKDNRAESFSYSNFGASSRKLVNGSWDGWGYQSFDNPSYSGVIPRAPWTAAQPPVQLPEGEEPTDENAYWGQMYKNAEHQSIVELGMANKAENLSVKWSYDFGGYSGQPVIAGDYMYNTSGKKIYKINVKDGTKVAEGDLAGSIGFFSMLAYGDGKIFVTMNNGLLQAFDAVTLESLWQTEAVSGMQQLCPIVYYDGYVYTGMWKGGRPATGVYYCVSTEDEDPSRTDEVKSVAWQTESVGFYWSGGTIVGDHIYVGGDDGVMRGYDRRTGEVIDSYQIAPELETSTIRSGTSYDEGTQRLYFTGKESMKIYSIKINSDGTFDKESILSSDVSGQATTTPTVWNGRVYATSGTMTSGGGFDVFDASTLEKIYSVDMGGISQSTPVVCTAYAHESNKNKVYIYVCLNNSTGDMVCIEDFEGNTEPKIAYKWTAPQTQYCTHSVVVDQYGTIYYKNDSRGFWALESKLEADGLYLDRDGLGMNVGEQMRLTATLLPVGVDAELTWSSSDDGIAVVGEDGTVTAVAEGEAVITVKTVDGGHTAECTVTVEKPAVPATGVTLDRTEATLKIGDVLTLTATVTPYDATDKSVTWSSSDDEIAVVDEDGTVTAVAEGEAVITVKTVDGGHTAECKVTVKDVSTAVDGVSMIGGIYPNPFESVFHITVADDVTMYIYDVNGRMVMTEELRAGENTVDASSLTPGIYIVRCGNDTYRVIKR